MKEVAPTGLWDSELPPVLVWSGGRGNDSGITEAFLCIRRGNHIESVGWYPVAGLENAIHAAGMVAPAIARLTEPAEEVLT